MKYREALSHVKGEPLFYARYRELGGKLSQARYHHVAAHFVVHTFDIYICGDCTRYQSRGAAWAAFERWLREKYPGESAGRIFRSQDDVHAYT
jgi:hypothetical protein